MPYSTWSTYYASPLFTHQQQQQPKPPSGIRSKGGGGPPAAEQYHNPLCVSAARSMGTSCSSSSHWELSGTQRGTQHVCCLSGRLVPTNGSTLHHPTLPAMHVKVGPPNCKFWVKIFYVRVPTGLAYGQLQPAAKQGCTLGVCCSLLHLATANYGRLGI